ncbi:MAG: substrate-binding domain-containing protein [Sciscionella sp.]
MGRHRSAGSARSRGVAAWPLAAVGLVVLLAASWFGWNSLRHTQQVQAATSQRCSSGTVTVTIAAAPEIAPALDRLAANYTRQRHEVRDSCIRVHISSIAPATVLAGLTQGWPSRLGPQPQAWVPDGTQWTHRLSTQSPTLIGSPGRSIATSQVVLAVPSPVYDAVSHGSALAWSDVAPLSSGLHGWERYGHPNWGRFSVAIPDPATNPDSALALQATLVGSSSTGAGPLTESMLASAHARSALATLTAAAPASTPKTTAAALQILGKQNSLNAKTPFSSVPVSEVELYRYDKHVSPGAYVLSALMPAGASPRIDFPFTTLAGPAVSDEQSMAAQVFAASLRQPGARKTLAAQGLQVPGDFPQPHDVARFRWASTTEPLRPSDAATERQLDAQWAAGSQAVTVFVDTSGSMLATDGSRQSRLAWVADGLRAHVASRTPGALGLWQFAENLDGDQPYRQLVPLAPTALSHDSLTTAINGLRSSGPAQLYSSIAASYLSAIDYYELGKTNKVIVITSSANSGGIGTDTMRSLMERSRRADHPISVSIIAIGDQPDTAVLGTVAREFHGTLSSIKGGQDFANAFDNALAAD